MNGFGHFLRAVGLVQQLLVRVRRDAAGDLGGVLGARHRRRRGAAAGVRRRASCAADRARCWRVLAIAFVAIGGWIFYNTNVVNEYLPSDVVLDRQARFEKEYRKYKDLPQPRITDVYADVDIYPARAARRDPRALSARQQDCGPDPRPARHAVARRRVARDRRLHRRSWSRTTVEAGYRIYRLAEPLAAGRHDGVAVRGRARGARLHEHRHAAVRRRRRRALAAQLQRHVLQQHRHVPAPRLQPGRADPRPQRAPQARARRRAARGEARRRVGARQHGRSRMPTGSTSKPSSAPARTRSRSRRATCSANGPQGGRRYFHYKMDRPMLAFFCYLSARYEVRQRRLARTADRDLLRRQASLQRRPDDRGHAASRSTTSRRTSRRTSTSRCASSSSRATRASRRASPTPSRSPSRSASSPTCAIPTTSTTSSTSPRTRSRTSGGRTR